MAATALAFVSLLVFALTGTKKCKLIKIWMVIKLQTKDHSRGSCAVCAPSCVWCHFFQFPTTHYLNPSLLPGRAGFIIVTYCDGKRLTSNFSITLMCSGVPHLDFHLGSLAIGREINWQKRHPLKQLFLPFVDDIIFSRWNRLSPPWFMHCNHTSTPAGAYVYGYVGA